MQKPTSRITHTLDGGCVNFTIETIFLCSSCFMSIQNLSIISGTRWAIKIDMQHKRHACTMHWDLELYRTCLQMQFHRAIETNQICVHFDGHYSLPLSPFWYYVHFYMWLLLAAYEVNGEHWTCLQEIDSLDDFVCKVHRMTILRQFVFKYFCW